MNVSKYKALLTAVDLGSFSAAAQKLGYTQSGLTHMMNSLEDEVGFPLLQRGYYGVKLTRAGERVIRRIRELVACEDALENEISLVRSFGGDVIRIGSYSSMAAHILPSVAETLAREFPDISLNIQTGTVSDLFSGLEDGRFDMIFASRNPKYDFHTIPLAKDRFFAILPKNFPLEGEEFSLSGFNGTKFLMPGLGFDDDINAVFSENRVKPFVTPTYVDDPAILSMVEHGLGISMLSELILIGQKEKVSCVPITPYVCRELCIATRKDAVLSPAARRLIAVTKDFAKNFFTRNLVNMNKKE